VPNDVKDAMELLHEVAAGATISTSRSSGRITSISIVNSGSTSTLADLQEKFNDAINSHDELEEQDGYAP
jgi:hypothetical protein